jgi:hypothetical protein
MTSAIKRRPDACSDSTMNTICELQRLYECGIVFTLQPDAGCAFLVGHGDYLHRAENTAVLPTFDQAVGWLMEQVYSCSPERQYDLDCAKQLPRIALPPAAASTQMLNFQIDPA